MTVKTLLTFTMIVTAVFVFKDVSVKTLIDITLAVIAVLEVKDEKEEILREAYEITD